MEIWALPDPALLGQPPPTYVEVAACGTVTTHQQTPHVTATCAAWLQTAPHDLLAVGTSLGSALILQVTGWGADGQLQLQPLSQVQEPLGPLRGVGFFPSPLGETQTRSRQLLLTTGHMGRVTLWDWRGPEEAYLETPLVRQMVSSWTYQPDPQALLYTCDDGSIRVLHLDAKLLSTPSSRLSGMGLIQGNLLGALWALDCQSDAQILFYTGEDGEIDAFTYTWARSQCRTNIKHTVCVWLQGQLGLRDSLTGVCLPPLRMCSAWAACSGARTSWSKVWRSMGIRASRPFKRMAPRGQQCMGSWSGTPLDISRGRTATGQSPCLSGTCHSPPRRSSASRRGPLAGGASGSAQPVPRD